LSFLFRVFFCSFSLTNLAQLQAPLPIFPSSFVHLSFASLSSGQTSRILNYSTRLHNGFLDRVAAADFSQTKRIFLPLLFSDIYFLITNGHWFLSEDDEDNSKIGKPQSTAHLHLNHRVALISSPLTVVDSPSAGRTFTFMRGIRCERAKLEVAVKQKSECRLIYGRRMKLREFFLGFCGYLNERGTCSVRCPILA
jgi:hypothetical protein